MINQPLITILLATYNGERYLQNQLDSIVGQNYKNWRLFIRDDGSTDGTVALINDYIKNNKNITLDINRSSHHGALSNFTALFDQANQDILTGYVMFCDQDDIWLPQKIEASLRSMKETEQKYPGQPVLVYGNLAMITHDGQDMNQLIGLMPELSFNRTLIQNFAYGCTMMLNTPLRSTISHLPSDAANHDYWIALVASAFGYTAFLTEPMIYYRQHEQNVTSQGKGIKKRFRRFTTGFKLHLLTYKQLMIMLTCFRDDFNTKLSMGQRSALTGFLSGYQSGRFKMIYQIFKNKIYKLTLLQNVGMFYTILFFYSRFKKKE